jgi:hypothetical protein
MKQRRLEKERQAEEEREAKLAKELGLHANLDATSLPLENMEGLSMAEQMLLAEMSAMPSEFQDPVPVSFGTPENPRYVDEEAALQAALMPLPTDNQDCSPAEYRDCAAASRPPVPRRYDQQRIEHASVPRAHSGDQQLFNDSQESFASRRPPRPEEYRQVQHHDESFDRAADPAIDQFEQTSPVDQVEAEFLTPLERRALREKQRAEQRQALAVVPTTPQTMQRPNMQGALAVPESPVNDRYSSSVNKVRSSSSSAMDRLKQRMDRRQVEQVVCAEEEKNAKLMKGEGWQERIAERDQQVEMEKIQEAEMKRLSAERSNKRNVAMQRMLERREQRAAEIDSLEE